MQDSIQTYRITPAFAGIFFDSFTQSDAHWVTPAFAGIFFSALLRSQTLIESPPRLRENLCLQYSTPMREVQAFKKRRRKSPQNRLSFQRGPLVCLKKIKKRGRSPYFPTGSVTIVSQPCLLNSSTIVSISLSSWSARMLIPFRLSHLVTSSFLSLPCPRSL